MTCDLCGGQCPSCGRDLDPDVRTREVLDVLVRDFSDHFECVPYESVRVAEVAAWLSSRLVHWDAIERRHGRGGDE